MFLLPVSTFLIWDVNLGFNHYNDESTCFSSNRSISWSIFILKTAELSLTSLRLIKWAQQGITVLWTISLHVSLASSEKERSYVTEKVNLWSPVPHNNNQALNTR